METKKTACSMCIMTFFKIVYQIIITLNLQFLFWNKRKFIKYFDTFILPMGKCFMEKWHLINGRQEINEILICRISSIIAFWKWFKGSKFQPWMLVGRAQCRKYNGNCLLKCKTKEHVADVKINCQTSAIRDYSLAHLDAHSMKYWVWKKLQIMMKSRKHTER